MCIKSIYETDTQVRAIFKSMLQKLVLKTWTAFSTCLGHYTLFRVILKMLRFGKREYKHHCSLGKETLRHWVFRFIFILKWNQNTVSKL
jgi:hypothetical protein